MKNRELKKMFYINCKGQTYIPSIFEDEVWDYLMSTVGEYVGTTPIWENFCYVANTIYGGNLQQMKTDILNISRELTVFFDKCLEENFSTEKFPYNGPYTRFCEIPNGRYLTFDLRDATIQTLLHYNIISEENYNDIYAKYEKGETLKKCKWVTHIAFFNSIHPHRNKYGHNFAKQLIVDTINSDDTIFSEFNPILDKCYICGDKLYVPIWEKDLEKYNDILYKDYMASNGAKYFVDICEKRVIRRGNMAVVVNDSVKSTKVFYAEHTLNAISYDLYPQVYKKLIKQPSEKYDLAYGFDDDIRFFENTIWK